MSVERSQGHHSKSRAELRDYQETVIREQGSTAEAIPQDVEATDIPQPSRTLPSRLMPTQRRPALLEWLREEWGKALIGTIILTLLGWGGSTLFSLNREVGILVQSIQSLDARIQQVDDDIVRTEERMRSDIRDLESDLRRLEDRTNREP